MSPIDSIRDLLGPWPDRPALDAEVMSIEDCGSYRRETVQYSGADEDRITAFVNVPNGRSGPMPAVFCHHQHASQFDLGKSEVVGMAGDPDQAYAHELAEQGFVTIAPDAIGFEQRNWSPGGNMNVCWFELSRRLVQGRTLLARCLADVSTAIDYLETRAEVNMDRIGFIGHSYGGRTALWAPAFDRRIIASVSNCGCVSYRLSDDRTVGFQPEFVVPGLATTHDVEDVVGLYEGCALLISAGIDDEHSRGAQDLFDAVRGRLGERVELALYPTGQAFTRGMRERAYAFLRAWLQNQPDSDGWILARKCQGWIWASKVESGRVQR